MIRRLPLLLGALASLGAFAGSASAFQMVNVHAHESAACVDRWSSSACAHVTNDTRVINGPGTVTGGTLRYLATAGGCAYLFDVSRTIPANGTRNTQVAHNTTCLQGRFFYSLDTLAQGRFADEPVTTGWRLGIVAGTTSARRTTNQCITQRWVFCQQTRNVYNARTPMRTQADFRITTRPLLVQIVNNTPNTLVRSGPLADGKNVLISVRGDSADEPIQPGESAWMGGLRATEGKAVLGATFAFRATPDAQPDYAGGGVAFTVSVGPDGGRTSSCTPMFRPTLPPLTCSVEFAGANTGVTSAVVTITSAT